MPRPTPLDQYAGLEEGFDSPTKTSKDDKGHLTSQMGDLAHLEQSIAQSKEGKTQPSPVCSGSFPREISPVVNPQKAGQGKFEGFTSRTLLELEYGRTKYLKGFEDAKGLLSMVTPEGFTIVPDLELSGLRFDSTRWAKLVESIEESGNIPCKLCKDRR
jgi:hypothetical protein